MAEEQKPTVEVPEAPKPDTPAAEQAVAAETAAAAEDQPAEASKPVDAADAAETDAAKADDKKDEAKSVDEGHLGHKAQGASFPKNLIPSKEFFFFGSDAFDPKALVHYLKSEKSAETAYSNIAWASHTGKGLLFIGDKKAPTSVIHLADASEPEVDGSNKFHFTSKGNKHSFKAASAAERDGWVAQLKIKIAEAKELAATVAESETYKKTRDAFKPVLPVKDDKAADEAAPAESPKEKAGPTKRNSFFGGVFSKKEKKPAEAPKPAEDVTEASKEGEAAAADAAAPVIPPVESTTSLNVDVPNPPTEDVEAGGANSEAKEAKEKRKSSLPFAFGKRDKSPSPVDGEKSGKSAFSKLRATIKGKSASKSEEKPVEDAAKDEAAAEGVAKETAAAEEASKDATAEAGKVAETETENKPENVASAAPAVTAAA